MTKRQGMVLEFIRQYIAVHGFPPSYEDVAKGLSLKSRSNVHRMVHRLRKEGRLELKQRKFRSVRPVDRTVEEVASL
jgi:repressor LexA